MNAIIKLLFGLFMWFFVKMIVLSYVFSRVIVDSFYDVSMASLPMYTQLTGIAILAGVILFFIVDIIKIDDTNQKNKLRSC